MKMNATLELEPAEIKKAVILYIEHETGKKVENESFKFNVGRQPVGYGMAEHDEWYFKGCTAKVVGGI
jgi:hypothetical protein